MTTIFFAALAALLASSTPIFIALAGAVMFVIWLDGFMPMAIVVERMFSGIDSFALMAIPFFILTGTLMGVGGLSRRIVNSTAQMCLHLIRRSSKSGQVQTPALGSTS